MKKTKMFEEGGTDWFHSPETFVKQVSKGKIVNFFWKYWRKGLKISLVKFLGDFSVFPFLFFWNS